MASNVGPKGEILPIIYGPCHGISTSIPHPFDFRWRLWIVLYHNEISFFHDKDYVTEANVN